MKRLHWLAVLLFGIVSVSHGQNLVQNGDFEADTYTNWPGYNGGGDNPVEITGWTPIAGGQGINPVYAVQNPSSIPGWSLGEEAPGGIGLNPIAGGESPFADNGDLTGGSLFMQNATSVYQVVEGLTIGETYTFSVDYNARNCCGDPPDTPTVSLELNGDLAERFPDPDEFLDGEVYPVEVGDWWNSEFEYTATEETLRVEFFTEATFGGDATFTIDNVSLLADAGSENLIVNGDFEQNVDAFVVFPGYLGTDVQVQAPFRDNGANQSQVAFLQGDAAMMQEITGVTPGTEYTLSFEYNSRNCCGDVPVPQLIVDEEVVEQFADQAGGVVAVDGENDWYTFEWTYTPTEDFVTIQFGTSPESGGDATFLVDNVFFGIPDTNSCNATTQGDVNGSGNVDFADFLVLSGNFGAQVDSHLQGDLNCDGKVDFADFLVLSGNFGKSVSQSQAVPEPAAALTWCVGGLGLMTVRRRRKDSSI